MRYVVYIIVLIICVVSLIFIQQVIVVNIIAGIAASILFIMLDVVVSNMNYLKWWFISIRFWNTHIRLSISYLFRIKVDDKYLLVRGVRFPDQFQPVGGVWKRLPDSRNFFERIEALDDDFVPIDKTSKDDLRIRVKGKHLVSFIKWYKCGKDRETSPWREFHEELVATNYLPHNIFPYIFYKHLKRHEEPIRYSDYAQSPEILIADIYELIPNEDQVAILKELSHTQGENYTWVDAERIRRRGAIPKVQLTGNISNHSRWIL